MAFFAGLNPGCCLCTSLFSGRSVDVHWYLDCQRQNIRSWWCRMSEVLNVIFPSSVSPRTQTLHLSFAFSCLGCHRCWVCVVHSHCWWHFPFHPVPLVSRGPLQLQAQIAGFGGWGFFIWFQICRKACGDGHNCEKLSSSIDRLEIGNWSGNGLKFRIVVSPLLLLFS